MSEASAENVDRADTHGVTLPSTIDGVLARMRSIDAALPEADGVAVFNRMYLRVTTSIAALIGGGGAGRPAQFQHVSTMADLDVRFANRWLAACDADVAHHRVATPWQPLFQARARGCLPIQYAIAGMNSHIEHDLPIAVVETCAAHHIEPGDIHRDYEAVNGVLAQVESSIRRSFLDTVGREVDDRIGPVVHALNLWNIDKARDLSWVTAEILWTLRETPILRDRYLDSLGHTVGMTSRALLTPPVGPLPPGL